MTRNIFTILLTSAIIIINGCATNSSKINHQTAGTYSVYGNWCGPDHPKHTINPPEPIDRLDASCMKHDICYTNKGYLNCECDKALNDELKKDLTDKVYTKDQSRYAKNIHRYFITSPCDGDAKAKAAPTRILQNAYKKTKRGLSNLWDKIMPENEQPEADAAKEK